MANIGDTVWITKYALTVGIYPATINGFGGIAHSMIEAQAEYATYYHKPYWHASKEDAIAHAESMRQRKIAVIKKSLSKLESLRFE